MLWLRSVAQQVVGPDGIVAEGEARVGLEGEGQGDREVLRAGAVVEHAKRQRYFGETGRRILAAACFTAWASSRGLATTASPPQLNTQRSISCRLESVMRSSTPQFFNSRNRCDSGPFF